MSIFATGLAILAVSIISALVGVVFLRSTAPRLKTDPLQVTAMEQEGIVFLFNGRDLLDATDRARSLLPPQHEGIDDMARFLSAFGPRFARLERQLTGLDPASPMTLCERVNDPMSLTLHAELHQGTLRIALTDPRKIETSETFERYAVQAMEAELDVLRSVAEVSPVLTWRQQEDGTVVWANAAYIDEVQRDTDGDQLRAWPPRNLFPRLALQPTDQPPEQPRRASLDLANDEATRWFEIRSYPGEANTLCFATPIDDLVHAEASLKEFIGTLGKTFAQLPIGLAIFDAKRHLVLFNPALVDLTALGAEVLTQRPSLHAFLDALRENQRIPEPRDYKSWRLRIAQLEAAATGGRYLETWTLPTGQTYRVTGQPHPDGAVAFLFEDISTEMSVTRRHRAEIDMGIAVLNALDHGVAMFTRDGTLRLGNTRYRAIWDIDPAVSLSRISLDDSMRHWGLGPDDHALMAKLQSFVLAGNKRVKFDFPLTTLSGDQVIAEVSALPQRASLVSFHPVEDAKDQSSQTVGTRMIAS